MITDKDREDKNDAYDVALKILSLCNTESTPGNIADIINKHATESAEQARKEAADRAVAFIRTLNSESMDLWGEYEDNGLRAAILGDSVVKENLTADHIPDTEKLAIAVKALEEIQAFDTGTWDRPVPFSELWRQARNISDNALKEIQG